MTNSVRLFVAVPAALFSLVALVAQQPPAGADAKGTVNIGLYQKQTPAPTGPAPKFADGRPDFTGVWVGGGSNDSDISRGLKPGDSVVPLPWAEENV